MLRRRDCPRKDVPLTGATRIIQRVTCVAGGGRKSCSGTGSNFVRTARIEVVLEDGVAPSASISPSTRLARGEWVSGTEPLGYDADDNVGVKSANASIGNARSRSTIVCAGWCRRGCAYSLRSRRVRWAGAMEMDTTRAPEGTQSLAVDVSDPGGNSAAATPVVARIDNTPPGRVDVGVTAGGGWRNHSDVEVNWVNPAETDRAPIAAATYKLCPTAGGECRNGDVAGDGISRVGVTVPSPGQWSVSLWLRDAAGNQSALAASAPVTVGYDPDSPQVAFEPRSPSDPALVAANASDAISGVVDSGIEMSRTGEDTWHELAVERSAGRLTARIDDVALPAGTYRLRTRAVDAAGNETVAGLGPDGQPMVVSLPIRIVSKLETGFERERTVRETVRRNGRSREVKRRVTVQSPTARVLFGASAVVAGRLVSADGNGIAGATVQVFVASPLGPEQPVRVVQSDAEGRYRYVTPAARIKRCDSRIQDPGSSCRRRAG